MCRAWFREAKEVQDERCIFWTTRRQGCDPNGLFTKEDYSKWQEVSKLTWPNDNRSREKRR